MSFTTLTAVKNALGIPAADTSKDAQLQPLVDSANAELLAFFGLTQCDAQQYTNKYDTWDSTTDDLWLSPYPVVSVDSVSFDAVAVNAADYYLSRPTSFGQLSMLERSFPFGRQRIEVTHTAGWAPGDVPADLQRAGTLLAIHAFNTDARAGYDSEKIGQYSYKMGPAAAGAAGDGGGGAYPPSVSRILAFYRRPFASDH